MARLTPEFAIKSYGLYTAWNRNDKSLPKVIKHTLSIPAEVGVEFGFILSVKKAKGEVLFYLINHPPFTDETGQVTPSFEGTYFISSNDFEFFLGDTIWEPVENKRGLWELSVYYKGKEIARKSFLLE